MSQHIDLNARTRAVTACKRKFAGQYLDWGNTDCVKLAALALRKQGVPARILKGVRYSSERTALRRLSEMGFGSLSDAMDATGLVRVPPSRALPGDIVALPAAGQSALDVSLMVCVSAGSKELLGLDGAGRFAIIRPAGQFVAGWRVQDG